MSAENPTDEEIWWKGRARPVLTRAEFDALPNADLTVFMACNVLRFYCVNAMADSDEHPAIWWEGAEGYPTEFTIVKATDKQGRAPFAPLAGCLKSISCLEKMCEVKLAHRDPREFCWACLRSGGFTPGFRFAGEVCFIDPKPKWPHV